MNIKYLTTDRVGPFVDRTYRETSRFQWARELAVNATEAGATRIHFGIEWQGVANSRVYRRTIVDNGRGMNQEELRKFFGTYGGGGKPIGGAHENFGIGAKTTLLPWNHLGIVVVSWQNGQANMIRIKREASTGEYGLQVYDAEDEDGNAVKEVVVEPFYDEEFSIDWNLVKPDWIEDHGTVIVLLGNDSSQDTLNGDPDRNEDGIRMLPQYLNHRFWRPGDVKITVLEFGNISDKSKWPTVDANTPNMGRDGYMQRTAYGAEYYMARQATFPGHEVKQGTVMVGGGQVAIDWYLWAPPEKPYRDNRGPRSGSINVLYRNELYHHRDALCSFRSFGICEKVVRDNLWLVIRPPEGDPSRGRIGVYPKADRSAMTWCATHGAEELPLQDWAEEFAGNMPAAIIDSLKQARKDQPSTVNDDNWRRKLAQRFAARFKLPRFRPNTDGTTTAAENNIVNLVPRDERRNDNPNPRPRRKPRACNSNTPTFARSGTAQKATENNLYLGLPNCVFIDDPADFEPGMLAAWTPPNSSEPSGLIQIYRDHDIFKQIVSLAQKDYQGYHADKVRDVVEAVYREVAVCKVAHIHEMRRFVTREVVDEMLSPRALTATLLGMISEDAMVRQRLAATIGRRKKKQAA
jgi:hypothetical protein